MQNSLLNPKKIITLFSGGGLFVCGAIAAGLKPVGAVEWDRDIASVYSRNFNSPVTIGPIENVNPRQWKMSVGELDVLQASPVCKNLSVANTNHKKAGKSGETYSDLNGALSVVRHIASLRPKVFILEQVWGYTSSYCFKMICNSLKKLDYNFTFEHINAADYGTPQTRKRLFLIAIQNNIGFASFPPKTHAEIVPESQQLNLFQMFDTPEEIKKWVSWYDAIKDLIPAIQESDFAKWQYQRLEKLASEGKLDEIAKRFLRNESTALAVEGSNIRVNKEGGLIGNITVRNENEPLWTLTTNDRPSHLPKALLLPAANVFPVRENEDPGLTLCTAGNWKSVIWEKQIDLLFKSWQKMSATEKVRYLIGEGRIVTLSTRCIARIQGLPDSYELPTEYDPGNKRSRRIACTAIGNGVAVPVAEALCRWAIKMLQERERRSSG